MLSVRRTISGAVIATALVAGTALPAHAYNGDRITRASHRIVGTTVKNQKTHVWTSIIGTYRYYRILRHNGHRHRKAFRGIVVSAQRCKHTGCWGRVKEGRLWSPHQLGRAPRSSSRGPQAGAQGDFCVGPGSTACAAPWNWINSAVNKRMQQVNNSLVRPCAGGALAGFGVKVAEKTAGQIAAESGLLATGERAAGVFGPEGYAVGAMAGCFVGVGAHGWSDIQHIASSLNPFDKVAGGRRDRAHR